MVAVLLVPHLALSTAIFFALVCVGMLIYFVDHMASRINVDTVIELVSADLRTAFQRLTSEEPCLARPGASLWDGAVSVTDMRRGYLERLDAEMLADWAYEHGTRLCLAVRLGDYVFTGAPVCLAKPHVDGIGKAIAEYSAVDAGRASANDLEFAVRQLVEVAVRALSLGINDPATVISVLDRLGVALCDLVPRYLPSGVYARDGRVVLVVPQVGYDGLVDGMFHRRARTRSRRHHRRRALRARAEPSGNARAARRAHPRRCVSLRLRQAGSWGYSRTLRDV